jgi:uncharacterized protein (TIGR03067 family)
MRENPTMIRILMPLAACVLLVVAQPSQDAGKTELEKFHGEWTMLSMEIRGKQVPDKTAKDSKMTVKGDQMTVIFNNKASTATIKLDPSKDPKAIDVVFVGPAGKESPNPGIYKLEGDTLTLCRVAADKARPKEFSTAGGVGYLTVWKRAGK